MTACLSGVSERRIFWSQAALAVLAFGFAYAAVLVSLVSAWTHRNDYSHGFVVPLISLYFVWESRATLKSVPIEPALASGAALVGFSCLLLLLGEAASVVAVQQVSVLVAVPGMVLLLLGWKWLKALALPIAYLLFMIPPLFDALIGRLHWPFQLYSAATAAVILKALGVPVYHTAQFLELPGETLEVAKACSGIRFLVSIVALGVPLALLTQRTVGRRVLLIATAFVIGIGLNPIRITFISLWALRGGEVLHGPYHIFQGLFVSVVGFCVLFLIAWVLSDPAPGKLEPRTISGGSAEIPWPRFHWALFAAVVLLGGAGGRLQAGEPTPVRLVVPLAATPTVLGGWRQVRVPAGAGFVINGADESLDRFYRDHSGFVARLQIGYYAFQHQGKEMISYRLDELYEEARALEIGSDQRRFTVNQAVLRRPGNRRAVLFWHVIGGLDIDDILAAKAITARRWLFEGRNDGAIVLVSTELSPADDPRRSIEKLAEFARLARDIAALD